MAEHYSTIALTSRDNYDVALELRDINKPALSANAAENAIATFNPTKTKEYKIIVVHGDVASYAAGTAEWQIVIEVSNASNGTFSPVATVPLKGVASAREVAFAGKMVNDILPTAEWIRVRATKTGSPGNLVYGAFVTLF